MAQRVTQALYAAARDFYTQKPAAVIECAAALKISRTLASRMWLGPAPNYAPWAIPLKEALDLTKIEARQREDEERRAAIAKQQAQAEERAKLAQEAQEIEDNILRGARQDVAGGLVILSNVVGGILKLAKDVNAQLERGTDASGKAISLNPFEVMKLIRQFSMSTKSLVEAGTDLVTLSRLQQGQPTQIFGMTSFANMSIEDAEKEIKAAAEALERAKKLGIRVLDGGKKAV